MLLNLKKTNTTTLQGLIQVEWISAVQKYTQAYWTCISISKTAAQASTWELSGCLCSCCCRRVNSAEGKSSGGSSSVLIEYALEPLWSVYLPSLTWSEASRLWKAPPASISTRDVFFCVPTLCKDLINEICQSIFPVAWRQWIKRFAICTACGKN